MLFVIVGLIALFSGVPAGAFEVKWGRLAFVLLGLLFLVVLLPFPGFAWERLLIAPLLAALLALWGFSHDPKKRPLLRVLVVIWGLLVLAAIVSGGGSSNS